MKRFTFRGKLERSKWNERADWESIEGVMVATDFEEACTMLAGWVSCLLYSKKKDGACGGYYVVEMDGKTVRNTIGG